MTDRAHAIPAGIAGRLADVAPDHRSDASPREAASHAQLQWSCDAQSFFAPAADFRIDRVDQLRPFLVSVVSDGDLWMYLSSTGALTAGRNNEDRALFPYETDDKLHQLAGVTGPMTILRATTLSSGKTVIWRPFDPAARGVHRSMSKATLGNRVTFEERHEPLGLTFRYTWQPCRDFGWVRTCELLSDGPRTLQIDVLDGVTNLLPAQADLSLQRSGSCLLNAYSQAELDVPSNLAIYSLASRISDKADPCEALFANVAFATGLSTAKRWLSLDQLDAFIDGRPVADEHLITGRRGAFFVADRFELGRGETKRWRIALDAHRSQAQVAALQAMLLNDASTIESQIDRALAASERNLINLIAAADGQQRTADTLASAHHASNVLFNCMRGGAFATNDELPTSDFETSLAARNKAVAKRSKAFIASLPETIGYGDLLGEAAAQNVPQLLRLTMEYLPLTFGRRHGDPSRPWNRFDIRVTADDGSPILNYQGNWRDIFQNWEALATSYPVFIESMIAKFVNATTRDGFNPYRVMRDGFEYETPDPHDPWSHIGYWGDHQIIYLLKLLEASKQSHAGALDHLLSKKLFAYANVPYRLRPYAAMLEERRETIDFDWVTHRAIEAALPDIGTDARLIRDAAGEVVLVTLAEKLLVPALSKLSSFIPGLGIWMNTQRPEWNDANNALVGNGVSMVTLCYLRRYAAFCETLFATQKDQSFEVRREVVDWLHCVASILRDSSDAVADPLIRRAVLDALGASFDAYRSAAVTEEAIDMSAGQLAKFFGDVLVPLDETIRHCRRKDGLFHAYNLLQLRGDAIDATPLDVMLEGQVAVLSSGLLSPEEAADVVETMFDSGLWREDQQSFMLYPIRELPGFLQKNTVDEMAAMRCRPARKMLQENDVVVLARDVNGQVRFNGNIRNSRDLSSMLGALPNITADDRVELLALYEQTFNHHTFTGRSGAMYGYEGIGCVYWHMVAKLLLAVQENFWRAVDERSSSEVIDRLAALYQRVRAGLGFNKSSVDYGAFPLDAYSHTPLHAGAQQPGMTGQVKEEILTRLGELGVRISDGIVRFEPRLLSAKEFLKDPIDWLVVDRTGRQQPMTLDAGTLGFTFAGTPIIYRLSENREGTIAVLREGSRERIDGSAMGLAASRSLLARDGDIVSIEVAVPRHTLRNESNDVTTSDPTSEPIDEAIAEMSTQD